jgi:branched-chain amino acid transport system permease protein
MKASAAMPPPRRRALSADAVIPLVLLLLLAAIALRDVLPTPLAAPLDTLFGRYVGAIEYAIVSIVMALSIYLTLATGLLSLANAGFMAIGAYTGALLTIHRGWPVWACVLTALLLGAVIGYLFGRPVLRLRDVYLAIATLGFGEIVRILAINGNTIASWILRRDPSSVQIFSGAEITRIPPPRRVETWHLVIYLACVLYFVIMLRRSRWGRTLAAIRQDEAAAGAMGINVARYKTFAFAAGAAIAAGAGVFHGRLVRGVEPSSYGFARAVDTLAGAVLGGVATWVGPVVGASILSMLPEVLRRQNVDRFLSVQPEILYGILSGVILMLAIIYLPRGVADPVFWSRLFGRRRRDAQPLAGSTAITAEEREPPAEAQRERVE